MTDRTVELRAALRRRERLWVVLTLAAPLVLIAFLALMALLEARQQVWFYGRIEHYLRKWDHRWVQRVEVGERLLAEGRFERAAEYLARLDAEFPAQRAEHKRDQERERLLRALGESNAALDRKRRTLDAYRRLVQFDPRNYLNHFDLAQACLRFNEEAEAREHLERVLAINPTDQETLQVYVDLLWNNADYPGVVRAYEDYRNALLIRRVTLNVGEVEDWRPLSVDGRFHELRFRLPPLGESPLQFSIDAGPDPVELKWIRFEPSLRVGDSPTESAILTASDRLPVVDEDGTPGGWRFPWPVGGEPPRVRIRLRAFKSLDVGLAEQVGKAYENVMRRERAQEVRSQATGRGGAG